MNDKRYKEFLNELFTQYEESKNIKEYMEVPTANPILQPQGVPSVTQPSDTVNSPLVGSPTGAVIANMPPKEEIVKSAIVDDKSYFGGWNKTENYRTELGNGMQVTRINGGSLEYGFGNPTEQREYLCWNTNGYTIAKYSPETSQFLLNNQPIQVEYWAELPGLPQK